MKISVVYIVCILLFAGCGKEPVTPEQPLRTILFYMACDNNLWPEAGERIAKLESVPVPANCRLLVYSDMQGEMPRLLEISPGNTSGKAVLVHEYRECNSADAAVFASVLDTLRQLYPSQSYGLMVFSHASGWLPEHAYAHPSRQSVIVDRQSEMELPDFASAIPDGMFDFIVFETCFMAGIEVAWELKDKTGYIVASSAEIVSPGFTELYPEALPLLFEKEANLSGLIRSVADDYLSRPGDYGSLTLSLINTSRLEDIARIVQGCPMPTPVEIEQQGDADPLQSFSRGNHRLFFDFGDYYSRLLPPEKADKLRAALEQCVTDKVHTSFFMPSYNGFEIRSFSGLTTYVPQEQYPVLNKAHRKMKWRSQLRMNN